jgi:hypothetical protein
MTLNFGRRPSSDFPMITEYENLKVSSPAPGHYIIEGLPAGSTQTEEGRLVHPMSVHIPPSFPSGLLLEIVRDRGADVVRVDAVPVKEVEGVEDGVKDSDNGDFIPAKPGDVALSLILGALDENGGTMRIKELAAAAQIDADTIKAFSGQGFEVGAAGWVKLLNAGGEA